MKQTLLPLLFLALSALFVKGQSQRLVLLEEFTQASCGPCASANPGIMSILNANPTKITGIFYHTSWPGTDPMYNHNKVDPTARVSYYGFNYVPYSALDGNFFRGAPSDWNTNSVNTRYTVPSPLAITVNTRLSAINDSIFITMLVKATADISGIMAAHMVVIEKHIHYTTAPGSNGEKDFYNVVKKMLPSASGTALPSTLKTGDYIIVEGAWALANVFTISELSAVCFVQNNNGKEILQSANATVTPLTGVYGNDAQLTSISNILPKYCNEQVAPVVSIRNNGSSPLTSLNIKYFVNTGDTASYQWTGNLGFLETATIVLPAKDFILGDANSLKIFTEMPNSMSDEYGKNDTLTRIFSRAPVTSVSVTAKIKTDNNPQQITWNLKDSQDNVLYSGGPYADANTTYQQLFALQHGECYTFTIFDSGNNGICCSYGNGYYILVDGSTNFVTGTQFTNIQSSQFSTTLNVAIDELQAQTKLSVYPNPFSKTAAISFGLASAAKAKLQLLNLLGQNVLEIPETLYSGGNHEVMLDGSGLQPGIYQVVLRTGSKILTTKVSLAR
jgi:hypothetical protein